MQNYTRMTVQGLVSGRHSALVDAAAEALDSMAAANVVSLDGRRERVSRISELVAAVVPDYEVLPA